MRWRLFGTGGIRKKEKITIPSIFNSAPPSLIARDEMQAIGGISRGYYNHLHSTCRLLVGLAEDIITIYNIFNSAPSSLIAVDEMQAIGGISRGYYNHPQYF